MDPLFLSHFHQHARKLEDSRYYYHWNATAHSIVTDAAM